MSAAKRTAVLISGRGSNLKSLLQAFPGDAGPAAIRLVLTDKPGAPGLAHAEGHVGTTTATVPFDRKDRSGWEDRVQTTLDAMEIELVCLAGFMRILSPGFCARWAGRMLNIHPSLLPAYPGLDTHARALEDGVDAHGCTVHYVEPKVDAGPAIIQASVPVLQDDTADTLAARVLTQEHRAYPLALRLVAEGRVTYRDGAALFDDGRALPLMLNDTDAAA